MMTYVQSRGLPLKVGHTGALNPFRLWAASRDLCGALQRVAVKGTVERR